MTNHLAYQFFLYCVNLLPCYVEMNEKVICAIRKLWQSSWRNIICQWWKDNITSFYCEIVSCPWKKTWLGFFVIISERICYSNVMIWGGLYISVFLHQNSYNILSSYYNQAILKSEYISRRSYDKIIILSF
jgi:hypothetical protein